MSKRIEELRKQAEIAFDQKQYQKVIGLWSEIIELDPDDAEAYSNRSRAYNGKGEPDKALDDCNTAIELNPKGADAYGNRGNAYYLKGKHDKAIDDYTHAIELNPKDAKTYGNRGYVYNVKGEHDKALDDCNKAIKLKPKGAKAYYNRGLTYRSLSKKNEALKDFQEANRLDPKYFIEEVTKKDREKEQETQDFQSILKQLKKEFKWQAIIWLVVSILAVGFTLSMLFGRIELEVVNLYAIYVFSSVVTMIIIRQYTNAKQLRTEADNRLAMAKIFARVNSEKMEGYKEFIPPIITSIVYSMHKDQNTNNNDLLDLIKSIMDKK